ncbi:hypothetical protein BU14_0603s0004, partial [Porphyra umbilicalis]
MPTVPTRPPNPPPPIPPSLPVPNNQPMGEGAPAPDMAPQAMPDKAPTPAPDGAAPPAPETASPPAPDTAPQAAPDKAPMPTPDGAAPPAPDTASPPAPDTAPQAAPDKAPTPVPNGAAPPAPDTASPPTPDTAAPPAPERAPRPPGSTLTPLLLTRLVSPRNCMPQSSQEPCPPGLLLYAMFAPATAVASPPTTSSCASAVPVRPSHASDGRSFLPTSPAPPSEWLRAPVADCVVCDLAVASGEAADSSSSPSSSSSTSLTLANLVPPRSRGGEWPVPPSGCSRRRDVEPASPASHVDSLPSDTPKVVRQKGVKAGPRPEDARPLRVGTRPLVPTVVGAEVKPTEQALARHVAAPTPGHMASLPHDRPPPFSRASRTPAGLPARPPDRTSSTPRRCPRTGQPLMTLLCEQPSASARAAQAIAVAEKKGGNRRERPPVIHDNAPAPSHFRCSGAPPSLIVRICKGPGVRNPDPPPTGAEQRDMAGSPPRLALSRLCPDRSPTPHGIRWSQCADDGCTRFPPSFPDDAPPPPNSPRPVAVRPPSTPPPPPPPLAPPGG